jgi:hypothetical protein
VTSAIEFGGVTKIYKRVFGGERIEALKDVSFTVAPGEPKAGSPRAARRTGRGGATVEETGRRSKAHVEKTKRSTCLGSQFIHETLDEIGG